MLTNVEGHRRDLIADESCLACGGDEEDLDHLLRGCSVAQECWIRTYDLVDFNLRRFASLSD